MSELYFLMTQMPICDENQLFISLRIIKLNCKIIITQSRVARTAGILKESALLHCLTVTTGCSGCHDYTLASGLGVAWSHHS